MPASSPFLQVLMFGLGTLQVALTTALVVVLSGPPLAIELAKNRLLGLARDADAASRPKEAS